MYRDVDVREAYAASGMQKTADGGTAGGRDREAAVQTKIKQVDNRGALIISNCMEIA